MKINENIGDQDIKNDNNYVVSDRLIYVLLLNGYKEDTEKYFPKHFKLIHEFGYNQWEHKRHFTFNKSSSVEFDFVFIDVVMYNYQYNVLEISKDSLFNVFALNFIPGKYMEYFKEPYTVKKRYDEICEREINNEILTRKERNVKSSAKLALDSVKL